MFEIIQMFYRGRKCLSHQTLLFVRSKGTILFFHYEVINPHLNLDSLLYSCGLSGIALWWSKLSLTCHVIDINFISFTQEFKSLHHRNFDGNCKPWAFRSINNMNSLILSDTASVNTNRILCFMFLGESLYVLVYFTETRKYYW